MSKLCPVIASRRYHKRVTGRRIDLKNPVRFDEKCLWLKLFWDHPLIPLCADKYEVRGYVEKCGFPEVLVDCYAILERAEEIQWDRLPPQFVLKATHGYQSTIICLNKDRLDRRQAIETMDRWLGTTYGIKTVEKHYWTIKPRIVCERLVRANAGALPVDYKFYCFSGKVHCVLVCTRRLGKNSYFDYFDRDWTQKLNYDSGSSPRHLRIKKPDSLEKMIEVSERLSKPFPFVRVDLYDELGSVRFGEMTFFPAACSDPGLTEEGNDALGRLLVLP